MKWKFFIGAALVVGGALWKTGVPLLPILLGIGLAAVLNLRRHARAPKTKPRIESQARSLTRTVNP
jgi:4-hydroxybenzoate polyprenyltransferase